MKRFIHARVTLLGDYAASLLGERNKSFTANVFVNGSAGVINARPKEDGAADDRVDRIVDATLKENPDGTWQLEGRSEFLESIGLIAEDQRVAVAIKGGQCEGC